MNKLAKYQIQLANDPDTSGQKAFEIELRGFRLLLIAAILLAALAGWAVLATR